MLVSFPNLISKFVVGGFLFLRFFCPALVNPDNLFPDRKITFQNRRCFTLITKVLQNLSNGQYFGKKESHMNHEELNSFIERRHPDLVNFIEKMIYPEKKGLPAGLFYLNYFHFFFFCKK